MKKLFFAIFTLLIASTMLYAQPPEGKQFDPATIKERQKSKLKEDLKLTNAQAESVATIQMEYMPKLRGLRALEKEERQAKMKEINDAYKAKLKTALNDDKLVEQVMEYQEKQRKERMEKMRGGE